MLEGEVLLPTRVARRATGWAVAALGSAMLLAAPAAHSEPVQIQQPVKVDNVHDGLDVVVAVAQIAASLTALVALIFLARQVKGTRDDNNAQRALAFQERYTSREFSRTLSPVLAYFRVTGASDCVAKIKAEETATHAEAPCLPRTPRDLDSPRPCLNDVSHVLGFFEDVGTAHGRKLIDRQVLLHSFGGNAVQVLMAAWWYIAWLRANDLAGRRSSSTSSRAWSSDYWKVAKIVPKLGPKGGVRLFKSVIIVPPALDVPFRPWKDERKAAIDICWLLTGLDARQARRLALALAPPAVTA